MVILVGSTFKTLKRRARRGLVGCTVCTLWDISLGMDVYFWWVVCVLCVFCSVSVSHLSHHAVVTVEVDYILRDEAGREEAGSD